MKKHLIKPLLFCALLLSAAQFPACKGKTKEATSADTAVATTDTTAATTTAPVNVAGDDELTKNTKDVVKDFPSVTANVKDGEITLSGSLSRERLQKLMMLLNALHPKKINNNLTITK